MKTIGTIGLVLLSAATATAAPAVAGGSSSANQEVSEPYGYSEGSIQLFLDTPPLVVQGTPAPFGDVLAIGAGPKGFAVALTNGNSDFTIGLSGGVGYCVTSIVEVGGVVAFNLRSLSGNSNTSATLFDLTVEPILKFNFGSAIGNGNFNPFIMVGPLVGFANLSSSGFNTSSGEAGAEADLGAEVFIGHHWGLSLYVPVQVVDATAASTVTVSVGFGFGLFGYI